MEPQNKVTKGSRAKDRMKIGGILLVIVILIYIPSFYIWIYGKNITTDIIRMGDIEDSINIDAYLVRNEEILRSPFEGKFIPVVNEGEKVQAGAVVATVLKSSSESLLEEIKKIDLRIIQAQAGKTENQSFFSADVLKINSDIDQKLRLIIGESNTNSLVKLKQIKDDINILVQKKATIVGDLSTQDVHIKELKAEKQRVQDMLKSGTRDIVSVSSGIISYESDGYEAVLNTDSIKDITPDFLDKIKVKPAQRNSDDLRAELNKPFAKVIKDIECMVVFYIDKSKAQSIKVDDHLKIRINDVNKTVDAVIDYKSNEVQGKYVFAAKIDKAVSETAGLRKINVDLIKRSFSGLKVPLNSLVDVDTKNMKAKIVLVKANSAKYLEVKIVGKNEDFAIIDNPEVSFKGVSLYSSYIVYPKNIEEGQLID